VLDILVDPRLLEVRSGVPLSKGRVRA